MITWGGVGICSLMFVISLFIARGLKESDWDLSFRIFVGFLGTLLGTSVILVSLMFASMLYEIIEVSLR